MFFIKAVRFVHPFHTGCRMKATSTLKIALDTSPGSREVQIPCRILRDHCRCADCYNSTTFQRNRVPVGGSLPIAKNVASYSDGVSVEWDDGGGVNHQSWYSSSLLHSLAGSDPTAERQALQFWDSTFTPTRIDQYDLKQDLNDFEGKVVEPSVFGSRPAGLWRLCEELESKGLVVIWDVEPEPQGIEDLLSRLATIKATFYGSFWTFTAHGNDELPHADTAYTALPIGPHTDGTYLDHTPGIQVFSAIKPATTGGKSIFVDGFSAVMQLSDEQRSILAKLRVPHEYRDGDDKTCRRSLVCDDPVIDLSETGGVQKIRYNPYDRGVFPLARYSLEQAEAWYDAYAALSRRIHDPSAQLVCTMQPGDIYLLDNWRVLHGRTRFTGDRTLAGCYLDRDDIQSLLRVTRLHRANSVA